MKCPHQQHSPHPMYPAAHQHGQHYQQQHHHHHHHATSFPSPSSSAHHHHHHGGGAQVVSCCGPPPPPPGSYPPSSAQTLPSNHALLESTNYCYRTRTLPNSSSSPYLLPPDQQQTQTWLYLSPRTIGLFALSLVFILIWSSVISGVLVTHSVREHEIALHTAKLFELHKDVGQFAFEVGQEMLFTLNTSMSLLDQWTLRQANHSEPDAESNATEPRDQTSQPQPPPPLSFNLQSVSAKWNKTDSILEQVAASLALKGYLDFESDVQSQVDKLRSTCVHQVSSQWATVAASNGTNAPTLVFPALLDCVRAFQHSFNTLDTLLLKDTAWLSEKHSKLAMTDLVIRNMPYTLFVRGMVHRFTTLGLGFILVRSNFSHPFNMSEYFHYYFSSRQLIESSFVWNYRFLQKYLELERTDYQADMIMNFFDSRRVQEHDFYLKMSSIFSRMFNFETLNRIRSYIKKKNVESVERLMVVNGSNSKYVQDANLVSIQLNTDLIELMGLENIEQVMFNHQQMLSSVPLSNLWQKYDQLLRNQIGFMSRVQDFLNISISAHMNQVSLNEQHNLLYHSVVASILFLSVLFCLSLFLCTYCCSRNGNTGFQCHQHHHAASQGKSTLGRRMRRRFWNLSSPFSLFKSCFSTPFSSPTSPPRYPLLYKSTHHNMQHYQQPHNSPNAQSMVSSSSNHRSCPVPYCSSPNSFLMSTSSSGKRNHCGGGGGSGVINRYQTHNPPNGGSGVAASSGSKSAQLPYKSEKSQTSKHHSNGGSRQTTTTETTSLIGSGVVDQSMGCDHTSLGCCIVCPDNRCNGAAVVVPCDTEDPNGCSKCAATGKCSTCCTYNQESEDCITPVSTHSTKLNPSIFHHNQHKRERSKESSKRQSLSSSTLSVLSDSKNSTKSTNKDHSSVKEVSTSLDHSKTTENSIDELNDE